MTHPPGSPARRLDAPAAGPGATGTADVATHRRHGRSLWHHRDFSLLWTGAMISELGSAVTILALPLVAVTVLHATTFEVGLLGSASTLAFLLVALPAGVVVDRRRKRPLMVAADVGRMLMLGSVPVAASLGRLTLAQLYLVALATGVLTVLFDVAYQSFIPVLVTHDRLVEANARMSLPNSFSRVVGPGLAGGLVALVGAARAIAADALSYLASVVTLVLIRTREVGPGPRDDAARRSIGSEIAQGLGFVVRHPVLRRIVACTATSNLFSAIRLPLYVLFLVRTLHARPDAIGVVFSLGAAGGLFGGIVAGPVARRFGSARMLWLSKAAFGWLVFSIPLAQPGWATLLVSLGMFVDTASAMIYNVGQVSYRQAVCPPELLGRMNASIRWVIWGTLPLGGALGGWLGTLIGVRATLFVSVLGSWLAVLFIIASPLVRLREIPVHEAYRTGAGARSNQPPDPNPDDAADLPRPSGAHRRSATTRRGRPAGGSAPA